MGIITIIGWVVSVATALFLGKGAIDKIRGTQEMVGNFAYMKLEKYRVAVGVGELFAALLLLCPIFSLAGAILIVSFMSGAIALHLSLMGGAKTHIPALVGLGALLGHILTHCC
mgnify:CR=1 FL=1